MKYLLIDANNFGIRNSFANETLKTSDNIPSGVHYGCFQSLIMLKNLYPDHIILMCWDGKSKRRMAESTEAVEKGLIPSVYKDNREKDKEKMPQPLRDFFDQSPYLKKGFDVAGIPQIRLSSYEADDVVASYCKLLRDDHEIMCVTNDKDYYQLLHENVSISKWHRGEETIITLESFKKEYGIEPDQHIDVGAMMGDDGDNIFGVPSWGEGTALKEIKQLGSWENILNKYKEDLDPLREEFPDLKDDPERFEKLFNIVTPAEKKKREAGEEWKSKYAEIKIDMPYTGVALAVEEKKTKAIKKTVLLALMHEDRIRLAYSLKKMDLDIEDLPEIPSSVDSNEERLREYFDYYEIKDIVDEAIGVVLK
jgi:DNA polymerase-1